MNVLFSLSALVVTLTFAPDPSWDEEEPDEPNCSRSEAADAASVLYGEAEELAETATVALEHAATGARYAQAVEAIPEDERGGKQGTKYVEKAHAAFLKAFTDTAAAMDQRQMWLAEDRALLEAYLAIVARRRELGDPCLGDSSGAETALQLVVALDAQMRPPPPASVVPPPASTPPPERRPEPSRPSRPLIVGGAVALGVGGGLGLTALATGLGLALTAKGQLPGSDPEDRDRIFGRGTAGNALTITGIALLGTGIAVGVPLLVTGSVRAKRARRVSLRPTLGGLEGSF